MTDFNFFNKTPVHKYKKSDPILMILTLLFTGLGLVTLYFASADYGLSHHNDSLFYIKKQILPCIMGFVALVFFSLVKIDVMRKNLMVASLAVILLCVVTMITGNSYGTFAQRWLIIPGLGISFQPSEFVKIILVMFLANQFDKQESKLNRDEVTVFPAVVGLLVLTLVVIINDFSTGFLLLCTGIVMFFACGSKLLWLLPFSALAIPLAALMIFSEPERVERVIGWVSPDENIMDANYQPNMAREAISSGGFFGNGMGTGLEKTPLIPDVDSDYIFAAWAEAMGFTGVVIYLMILCALCWRIFYCAFTCYDRFASYVCFGIGTLIMAQALVNIGVVGGLLPSTGIPLPLFSAGGTSIVVLLSMCGFVINASRIEKVEKESKVEDLVYERFSI